jgi:2-keto-4-pentenoate hydratase/2-oxohepta-3-ene-1,7-dioic acid hydratase in catechol pathway
MPRWIRFEHENRTGFGTLEGETISVHDGDMFASPAATGEKLAHTSVKVLTPTQPTKMVALWNNFRALAKKLAMPEPAHPLYFLKSSNSFLATGETIMRPAAYDGRVIYEGELGIVIGRRSAHVPEAAAADHIFGYTCINDVTAFDILNADPTFPQWARAKSFDTFGVFGPVVATDLDPETLVVRTVLNGEERQNYPASDMIIPPHRIISLISQDMTLEPGDVICCGTSLGAGTMRESLNTIEISIEGIGTLSNVFDNGG